MKLQEIIDAQERAIEEASQRVEEGLAARARQEILQAEMTQLSELKDRRDFLTKRASDLCAAWRPTLEVFESLSALWPQETLEKIQKTEPSQQFTTQREGFKEALREFRSAMKGEQEAWFAMETVEAELKDRLEQAAEKHAKLSTLNTTASDNGAPRVDRFIARHIKGVTSDPTTDIAEINTIVDEWNTAVDKAAEALDKRVAADGALREASKLLGETMCSEALRNAIAAGLANQ